MLTIVLLQIDIIKIIDKCGIIKKNLLKNGSVKFILHLKNL